MISEHNRKISAIVKHHDELRKYSWYPYTVTLGGVPGWMYMIDVDRPWFEYMKKTKDKVTRMFCKEQHDAMHDLIRELRQEDEGINKDSCGFDFEKELQRI